MSNLFGGRSGKRAERKHFKALRNLLTKPLPGIGKIPPQDTPCRCTGCPTINDHPHVSIPDTPHPNDAIQGSVGGLVRTFETGANRDTDTEKIDYEGFMSPLVIQCFGEYMHKNRHLKDGSYRDSDNWQKFFGDKHKDVCMKSLMRHVMDLWLLHRGHEAREGIREAICGILFNAQAYLLKVLKEGK